MVRQTGGKVSIQKLLLSQRGPPRGRGVFISGAQIPETPEQWGASHRPQRDYYIHQQRKPAALPRAGGPAGPQNQEDDLQGPVM